MMPDFAAWAHDTLADFATEAAKTLREQELENQQLKEDLRVAIDAYRAVLRGHMQHASDCAVHNEPAYPAGPCDCGAKK